MLKLLFKVELKFELLLLKKLDIVVKEEKKKLELKKFEFKLELLKFELKKFELKKFEVKLVFKVDLFKEMFEWEEK